MSAPSGTRDAAALILTEENPSIGSFVGQLRDWVDLIKLVLCPFVCTSVHKKFFWFEWNLVCMYGMSDVQWYAVWHDPRSRLRSRDLEIYKFFHFQTLSPPPFTTWAGWFLSYSRISKFGRAGFLKYGLVFCVARVWTSLVCRSMESWSQCCVRLFCY